jgi:branched-chain amino acid transport system ATP-binding protein
MTRTYQISRLFAGLTVLDNLYLATLGVDHGHFSVLRRKKRDTALNDHAREIAGRVGLTPVLDTMVGTLSHGEQRQLEVGMALAGRPQLLLLDEPAAGLSPAERVSLTDLLLRLEPEITLIIIEHDMDIALRVAERVTMMHDGAVVVEGTPAEIRANELVHDLYLGRSHGE